mmetsp:Transcript_25120/g.82800  ORF Transcript_25120/g.82800 Transcript_25120/m.82800 type:complete len:295 (-) Transcript_25120:2623-3507(-)
MGLVRVAPVLVGRVDRSDPRKHHQLVDGGLRGDAQAIPPRRRLARVCDGQGAAAVQGLHRLPRRHHAHAYRQPPRPRVALTAARPQAVRRRAAGRGEADTPAEAGRRREAAAARSPGRVAEGGAAARRRGAVGDRAQPRRDDRASRGVVALRRLPLPHSHADVQLLGPEQRARGGGYLHRASRARARRAAARGGRQGRERRRPARRRGLRRHLECRAPDWRWRASTLPRRPRAVCLLARRAQHGGADAWNRAQGRDRRGGRDARRLAPPSGAVQGRRVRVGPGAWGPHGAGEAS